MVSYTDYNKLPNIYTGDIRIYDEEAFKAMRIIGKITAQCLDELAYIIKPGITTLDIDNYIFQFAFRNKVLPATLGYRGYKYSCCTSSNHIVCHGMPSSKILKEGDIINVDVTFILNGWHGDSSRMYPVGKLKPAAKRLLKVTYNSLMRGIEAVKPGNTTGDIGGAIEKYVLSEKCSVVKDFCGHGIGLLFHDTPNILNYRARGEEIVLKPGMIFTIEPMVNLGDSRVKILPDGWTAVTKDKSLSAQYEHTLAVTETGYEIFTNSRNGTFFIEG